MPASEIEIRESCGCGASFVFTAPSAYSGFAEGQLESFRKDHVHDGPLPKIDDAFREAERKALDDLARAHRAPGAAVGERPHWIGKQCERHGQTVCVECAFPPLLPQNTEQGGSEPTVDLEGET